MSVCCVSSTEYSVNKDYYKTKLRVKSDNLLCMLFVTKTADEIAIVEQSHHGLWLLVAVLVGSLLLYYIFHFCVVLPSGE